MIVKRAATMIAVATGCVLAGGPARSAPPAGNARPAAHPPTAEEFAALKQRVDQQYELLMKLTQIEGQHYDYLLRLLGSGRPVAPSSSPPPSPPVAEHDDGEQPSPGARKFGSISGQVAVKGRARGPIYVYVDNIKEPAVERHIEIMQKDRAFVPDAVIAQRGTHVSFPNSDPLLHNVFSPSPTQPFDLGSYKQGEKAGSVRLFKTGVVEVFCNMHARMRADILVVPNRHYVKANADGSFHLDNVPVGTRQVAAWTPYAQPVTETVNLTAAGASAKFELIPEPRAHVMKDGRAYESYKE
jgi:plastocyanin